MVRVAQKNPSSQAWWDIISKGKENKQIVEKNNRDNKASPQHLAIITRTRKYLPEYIGYSRSHIIDMH